MSETSLGAELRTKRGSRSLSDISRECGLPVSTLSRVEKGEIETPGRAVLEAISFGYGLPLEYLAQLVYLGKHPQEREPADDTPASELASSPAENEPPCEVPLTNGRRPRRLAAIS